MDNCSACQSLERAVERAKAEHNLEKQRIMQVLLAQHQKQHQQLPVQAVVVWKDGSRWILTQGV